MTDVSILDATALSLDEAAERVWSARPNLVGITAMGLDSVPSVAAFVRQLSLHRPRDEHDHQRAAIIVGGHGAAMAPRALLEAGADATVIGEGEVTLQEIVRGGIQPGAPGVVCQDGAHRIVAGPVRSPIDPLDQLPLPARDLIPHPPDGIHLLETSRGCPHDCAFCEATHYYGRRWRPHSPERVVTEVRSLVNDHEAMVILIADDNFAARPRRVRHICELLQERDLPALFMVSARGDDLVADPDLLPAMASARMLRVCVGVETLDPGVALAAGKPVPLETYRHAFQRMRELGMFAIASLIVGLPGEAPQARREAVERIVAVAPDAAQFVPYRPLPGTRMARAYTSSDPDPVDVRDAAQFTAAFYEHPSIRAQLQRAVNGGGIRGTLARGVLAPRAAPDTSS